MMGLVFTEILPWIIAALVVGFIVGWLFWRGRYGQYQAEIDEKLARARRLAKTHEARVNQLTGQVDLHKTEVARLSTKIDGLEDENAELSRTALQADAFRTRITELQAENQEFSKKASLVEGLNARIAELERDDTGARETDGVRARTGEMGVAPAEPELDFTEAERILGSKIRKDDLMVVEGIGPKIAELCNGIGIGTWRALSDIDVSTLQRMLEDAGPRYRMHDPSTWPRQARLLASGRWAEFKELTEELSGGRK